MKRRRTAGHAERLHHVEGPRHHEGPGLIDLTNHVDLVAEDLPGLHGNHWIRDISGDSLCYLGTQLIHRLSLGDKVADQREGQPAVRTNENFPFQVFFFPDGNQEDVAGLHPIACRPFRFLCLDPGTERQ